MAKKKKEQKIPEVLVFTDINNYTDDLASLVILAHLAEQKKINLKGIITQLGVYETRRRRALYAKGALVHLKQPFIRVVPGGDYEFEANAEDNHYPEDEFSKVFENAGTAILRSGMTFLQEYLKSVKDKNLIILLNAPFPDFVKYMNATQGTLLKKVKKIVIMGNVLADKNAEGQFQPDPESFNFKIAWPAAQTLFKYAQENALRLVLVRPEIVKDLEMDNTFLDNVSKSKNPVLQKLINSKTDTPYSMQFDMISALAVADTEFKKAGGQFVREDEKQNVFFATIEDKQLMKDAISDIFKEMFLPKKITLANLTRQPKDE